MSPENKRKIAKLLSLAVVIAGIMVMAGWVFNISLLKSVFPAWTTMKVSTAISFILSGVTLYFIIKAVEGDIDWAQIVLPAVSLIIILIMTVLLLSNLMNVRTGVEDLFVKEGPGAIKTIITGRPAIPTMINFMLIALAGILTMLGNKNLRIQLKIIGLIVASIGVLAVIGYLLNVAFLYYFVEGISSAMACHTAILFVMLGIGLICLSD